MGVLEVKAYAKLNLSLDVLGKRPDGYHEMRMVMQTVSLSDTLRLETGTGAPLHMGSNLGFLPTNEHNLAAAAALRLCEAAGVDPGGLSIDLEKAIPVCAGLAGGSADAAAVLRGLNRLLGLDLPGERLEEIGMPKGRAERTAALVRWHMTDLKGDMSEGKLRIFLVRHADIAEDLIALKRADAYATRGEDVGQLRMERVWREMLADGTPFKVTDLPVGGEDAVAAGLSGREIGDALSALLHDAVLDPVLRERERALGYLERRAKKRPE